MRSLSQKVWLPFPGINNHLHITMENRSLASYVTPHITMRDILEYQLSQGKITLSQFIKIIQLPKGDAIIEIKKIQEHGKQ